GSGDRRLALMTVTEANPLLEGLRLKRTPEPCIITIFGASGDLTARKLFPALYSLAFRRLLPEHFAVVGSARSEMSGDEFREAMRRAVEEHGRDPVRDDVWDWLAERTSYVPTEFVDQAHEDRLAVHLEKVDRQWEAQGNRVYYLAVPPMAMPMLVGELGKRRPSQGWTRLIIQKPFRHDLASAKELNATLAEHFAESEVFRIDHYLGKETVQNLMAL